MTFINEEFFPAAAGPPFDFETGPEIRVCSSNNLAKGFGNMRVLTAIKCQQHE